MTTDESEPRRPELRPAVPTADTTAAADGEAPADRTPGPDTDARSPTRLHWRVPLGIVVLKAAGACVFLLAGLLFARDSASVAVAVAAAALAGLYALRDLLAPVRLAADGDGVTVVTGFATLRRIRWREVERIRIDERSRLGMRSALLEIDTGSSLYLFGASELGTPVEDVADALRRLRTGR
ncbi:MAG: PH domain-containing protein [Micromonosporaceae bacterium]